MNKSAEVHLNGGQGHSGSSWRSLEVEPVSKTDVPRGSFLIHWPREDAKCQLTRRWKKMGGVSRWFPQGGAGELLVCRKEETTLATSKLEAGTPGRYYTAQPEVVSVLIHVHAYSTPSPWMGKTKGWEEPLRDVSELLSPRHSSPHFSPLVPWIISKHKYIAFKEQYLPATYERFVLPYWYPLFSYISHKLTFVQPALPVLTLNTLISKVWLSLHFSFLCFAC